MTEQGPIWILCEGSGHPPASEVLGICAMCGGVFSWEDTGFMVEHQRDDVLARIDRGDFG